jgi:hypothetical protein
MARRVVYSIVAALPAHGAQHIVGWYHTAHATRHPCQRWRDRRHPCHIGSRSIADDDNDEPKDATWVQWSECEDAKSRAGF